MFLELEGIKIEVVRRSVKRIRLTIKPDKSVVLTMPMRSPLVDGEVFARAHIPWLKKHLAKMNSLPPKEVETFENGTKIEIVGKPYTIKIIIQKRGITQLYEDFLFLSVPEDDPLHREAAVQKYFSGALFDYADQRIEHYVSIYGFKVNGLKIRKMSSRWGSCNVKTNVITLNSNLAAKPKELIDYVIMHELIHTLVPNHGKEFYAFFDKFMPNHRQLRKTLNGR